MTSILPPDQPQDPVCEPHNFFIYGATMSGKSYFSSFFSHPLELNTDGNAQQGTAPAIQLKNQRDQNGMIRTGVIEQLDSIITALGQPGVTYKTVILDVIDDICTLIEQEICSRYGKQSLSDIPYGKGYALFNTILSRLVTDLKGLPQDVIYISRELDITDEHTGRTRYVPSLKPKYYNLVNGNCDLVIRTIHEGNTYTRQVVAQRTKYAPDTIKDKRKRELLEKCGLFK